MVAVLVKPTDTKHWQTTNPIPPSALVGHQPQLLKRGSHGPRGGVDWFLCSTYSRRSFSAAGISIVDKSEMRADSAIDSWIPKSSAGTCHSAALLWRLIQAVPANYFWRLLRLWCFSILMEPNHFRVACLRFFHPRGSTLTGDIVQRQKLWKSFKCAGFVATTLLREDGMFALSRSPLLPASSPYLWSHIIFRNSTRSRSVSSHVTWFICDLADSLAWAQGIIEYSGLLMVSKGNSIINVITSYFLYGCWIIRAKNKGKWHYACVALTFCLRRWPIDVHICLSENLESCIIDRLENIWFGHSESA